MELDGERYLFYTQGEDLKDFNFGTVPVPKVLKTDGQGHLLACYYHGMEKYLGNVILSGVMDKVIHNYGQWGSIGKWSLDGQTLKGSCKTDWAMNVYECEGSNFMYTVDISIGSARSAGLAFRIQGKNVHGGAYVLLLDVDAGEVLFTKTRDFPRLEARKWNIERKNTYSVRIIAVDNILNVFIDDILALQMFYPGFSTGKLGLFVEQGEAFFSNIQAIDIKGRKA